MEGRGQQRVTHEHRAFPGAEEEEEEDGYADTEMANPSSLNANISFPERGALLHGLGGGGSHLFCAVADMGVFLGSPVRCPLAFGWE